MKKLNCLFHRQVFPVDVAGPVIADLLFAKQVIG